MWRLNNIFEKVVLLAAVWAFVTLSMLLSKFITLKSHFEVFEFIRDVAIASLLLFPLLGSSVVFVRYIRRTSFLKHHFFLCLLMRFLFVIALGLLFLFLGNIPFIEQLSFSVLINHIFLWPSIIISVMITTFTMTAVEFYYSFKDHQAREREMERLQRELLSFRYRQLKEQLNPHFLFNSLNVLTSLIHQDENRAADFTLKLSEVYRYVLSVDEHDLIELSQELSFIRSYVNVLRVRFPEGLFVEYDIKPESEKRSVSPLALQILVENAIKHNIVSSRFPLHIVIKVDDRMIEVSNNRIPQKGVVKSTGIGLNNLRMKYELLTEDLIEIIATENKFTVRIPLI